MKIQVTISGDLEELLRKASEESMRPLATEAVYRIKKGLESGGTTVIPTNTMYTVPSLKPNTAEYTGIPADLLGGGRSFVVPKPDEKTEEFIKKIETVNEEGYQGTVEEFGELTRELKENGYSYNAYKKTLDRRNDKGVWEVVHKF